MPNYYIEVEHSKSEKLIKKVIQHCRVSHFLELLGERDWVPITCIEVDDDFDPDDLEKLDTHTRLSRNEEELSLDLDALQVSSVDNPFTGLMTGE